MNIHPRDPLGARDEFHLAAAKHLLKLARLIPAPSPSAATG